jgi:hypothetical protein
MRTPLTHPQPNANRGQSKLQHVRRRSVVATAEQPVIPKRGRCAFICNTDIICPVCRLPVPANVRHQCDVSEQFKMVRNDPDE